MMLMDGFSGGIPALALYGALSRTTPGTTRSYITRGPRRANPPYARAAVGATVPATARRRARVSSRLRASQHRLRALRSREREDARRQHRAHRDDVKRRRQRERESARGGRKRGRRRKETLNLTAHGLSTGWRRGGVFFRSSRGSRRAPSPPLARARRGTS
eukprot:8427-Pelagococcus_subviridis.AAC.3